MLALKKIVFRVLGIVVNRQRAINTIIKLSRNYGIDLHQIGLNEKGILNFSSAESSGEHFLINKYLTSQFAGRKTLTFFDVGANVGKYSRALRLAFTNASIYAFEPNPNSFKRLPENVGNDNKTFLVNKGLSSKTESLEMTSYFNDSGSSHTSLHSQVFSDFHHSSNNVSIKADFITLDEFCKSVSVEHIDLLKIDTEGHELEVLKGAENKLRAGKIDVIQFEFGECHVYSRVFLKDFYSFLPNYSFYRLLTDGLLPLGEHSPANEIFQFQNIIAIRNDKIVA